MPLSQDKKSQILESAADFALRVMEGKECNPQETAVLPDVLDLLFSEEMSYAKRQWDI